MNAARPFRLDVRQRVIVKALVSRHRGGSPGKILAGHLQYLQRSRAGAEGERARFYSAETEGLAAQPVAREWAHDRHHFRFIISPEHGDRIRDMTAYVREIMGRVAADLNEPNLQWMAVNHFDTDNPHAHVVVRCRRGDGRDLVIPRAYMGYGFRARAQEAAQELLGDLSRDEAERRLWRETQADSFTRFDRTLLEQAHGNDGLAPDPAGRSGTYAALLRARLDHLEALELAKRTRDGYALNPGLERELHSLQISRDVIRTTTNVGSRAYSRSAELVRSPSAGPWSRAATTMSSAHRLTSSSETVPASSITRRCEPARLRQRWGGMSL